MPNAVIELTVRNHPGVMSHVTGLFARRAFNLEAITCAPVGDGENSRMLLLVAENERLGQVIKQLERLRDVTEAKLGDEGARERMRAVTRNLGEDK